MNRRTRVAAWMAAGLSAVALGGTAQTPEPAAGRVARDPDVKFSADTLSRTLTELAGAASQTAKELEAAKQTVAVQQHEIERLKTTRATDEARWREDSQRLKTEAAAAAAQVTRLEQVLAETQRKEREASLRQADLEKQAAAASGAAQKLKLELDGSLQQKQALSQTAKDQLAQLDDARKQIQSREQELGRAKAAAEEQRANLVAESDRLKADAVAAARQFAERETKWRETLAAGAQREAAYSNRLAQLQKASDTSAAVLARATEETEQLRVKVRSLAEQLAQRIADLNTARTQAEDKDRRLKEQESASAQQAASAKEETDRLRAEPTAAAGKVRTLEDQLKQAVARADEQEKALSARIAELRVSAGARDQALEDAKKRVEELGGQLRSLSDAAKRQADDSSLLSQTLASKTREFGELKTASAAREKELTAKTAELQRAVSNAVSRAASAETTLAELKNAAQKREQELLGRLGELESSSRARAEALEKTTRDLSRRQEDLDKLRLERQELAKKVADLELQLGAVTRDSEKREKETQARLALLNAEATALARSFTNATREAELQRQKADAGTQDKGGREGELAALREQLAAREKEAAEWRRAAEQTAAKTSETTTALQREKSAIEARLAQAGNDLEAAKTELARKDEESLKLKGRMEDRENEVRRLLDSLRVEREKRAEAAVVAGVGASASNEIARARVRAEEMKSLADARDAELAAIKGQLAARDEELAALKATRTATATTPATVGAGEPDHALVARLRELERKLKAEALYQEGRLAREYAPNRESAALAGALNDVALVLAGEGRVKEALPLLQRAHGLYMKVHGPKHPSVAACLANLADLYRLSGQLDEAVAAARQSLALFESGYGSEHPRVATAASDLGYLCRLKGQNEEARQLYQQAVRSLERTLGEKHPFLAPPLNNLAMLHMGDRQYQDAEPLLERALTIVEDSQGPDHANALTVLKNLRVLYLAIGKTELAKRYEERINAILEGMVRSQAGAER